MKLLNKILVWPGVTLCTMIFMAVFAISKRKTDPDINDAMDDAYESIREHIVFIAMILNILLYRELLNYIF